MTQNKTTTKQNNKKPRQNKQNPNQTPSNNPNEGHGKFLRELQDTEVRNCVRWWTCLWTERINIVAILPKAVFNFSVIPVKIPVTFFTKLNKESFPNKPS